MNYCKYENLLRDLEKCTELINGDMYEIMELSREEREAIIEILEIFQETLENVGDVRDFMEDISLSL